MKYSENIEKGTNVNRFSTQGINTDVDECTKICSMAQMKS